MSELTPLLRSFYARPAQDVARDLLGRYLVRHLEEGEESLVLRLVETEAYLGEGDLASHASKGPVTERARKLFRPPGMAYVYLIYGMHHCMNAVTGSGDDGSAVLLRAGAPVGGVDEMVRRRSWENKRVRQGDVAGGPGKLCQALGIDGGFDGRPLWEGELVMTEGEPVADGEVATGPRIGVDYAGDAATWPLRYGVRGEREMSRPVLG